MNAFTPERPQAVLTEFLQAWKALDWPVVTQLTTLTFQDQYKPVIVSKTGQRAYHITPTSYLKDMLGAFHLTAFEILGPAHLSIVETTKIVQAIPAMAGSVPGTAALLYIADISVVVSGSIKSDRVRRTVFFENVQRLMNVRLVCEAGVRRSSPEGVWGVNPFSLTRQSPMVELSS